MNIVAGYNWQFIAIELLGLVVWLSLLRQETFRKPEWWFTLGLALHSAGALIRIGYWALATLGAESVDPEQHCVPYPQWAIDYRHALFWAIQMSTVGIACMLRSKFERLWGRGWWCPTACVAAIGFLFGGFI